MPRPKGSKNDKNQLNKLNRTSSPLPLLQTSILLSNEFINDDINWIKTSVNKGGRPKKIEFINENDESIIMTNTPISSSSEISGGRVVVNPAVLRYLEQNRNMNYQETEEFYNQNTAMNINEGKDDNSFDDLLKSFTVDESIIHEQTFFCPMLSNERYVSIDEFIELGKFIQDDLFYDFWTCSTEFLTSARLAEWILTHEQSAKLEAISLSN